MTTTAPQPPIQMYSIEGIAEVCDVSKSTVYKWVKKDDFPKCVRLPNGQIRVMHDDFEAWLYDHFEAA